MSRRPSVDENLQNTEPIGEVGLTAADASARLADFDAWRAAMSLPVDMAASDARLAYVYVRRFELRLRAPDALHLATARRLGASLITLDRRLASAARELGVAVEELAAR